MLVIKAKTEFTLELVWTKFCISQHNFTLKTKQKETKKNTKKRRRGEDEEEKEEEQLTQAYRSSYYSVAQSNKTGPVYNSFARDGKTNVCLDRRVGGHRGLNTR